MGSRQVVKKRKGDGDVLLNNCSEGSVSEVSAGSVSEVSAGSVSEVSAGSVSKVSSINPDSMIEENYIITKDIIDEEEHMAKHIAKEEERIKKELEEQERMINEDRQLKQKRLFHLLGRSKFYTQFLLEKIQQTKNYELKQKELKLKRQEKLAENGKKNTTGAEAIPLKEVKNGNVKTRKKRKTEKIEKITDYFNTSDIEKVKYQEPEDDQILGAQAIENSTTETKITDLGFEVPISQPTLFEGGVLRDYQLQGLDWMRILYENGVNGILADEMGLGKTIQIIALICYMIERQVAGPFLIIAPLSTLSNWMMEFEKYAPRVPVVLFHGSKDVRPTLYKKLTAKVNVLGCPIAPVVITSYQVPQIEYNVMSKLNWKYIIIDEGHVLKNINSVLGRCLRSLHSVNRLLLTGTPLQNNLEELWALLNFLLPEIFDDFAMFSDIIKLEDVGNSILDQEDKHKMLSILHQILLPFLLRRVKSDVEINLPPKKELLVHCPMTSIQLDMYKTTVDRTIVNILKPQNSIATEIDLGGVRPKRKCAQKKRNYARGLESDDDDDNDFESSSKASDDENTVVVKDQSDPTYISRFAMANPAMQLRKIVNHPYLVHMPVNPDMTMKINEELVNKSGKMLVIDALLSKLKERGHKVLIFSFFKILLDILEEFMYMRNYKYTRLDGGCDFDQRKEAIRSFNTDPNVFAFLITTRAGGLGLNLTAADTVIIFDSDWNPQADLQAMDRCHRIGQVKPTVVYRLVTKGTIDEHIINVAARKRKLEKMVIRKGKFKLNLHSKQDLSELEELKQLLESTDHQKVVHSNGFVFSNEELEELLDRSDMSEKKNDSEELNT